MVSFWKLEVWGTIVLPNTRQVIFKMAKIGRKCQKFKWDILSNFQKLWERDKGMLKFGFIIWTLEFRFWKKIDYFVTSGIYRMLMSPTKSQSTSRTRKVKILPLDNAMFSMNFLVLLQLSRCVSFWNTFSIMNFFSMKKKFLMEMTGIFSYLCNLSIFQCVYCRFRHFIIFVRFSIFVQFSTLV